MNKQTRLNSIIMPAIAGILVIIDRLLKSMAIAGCFDKPINLIGDFLKLSFTGNSNIAFSLPLSGRLAEAAIILILAVLLVYFIVLLKKGEYNQAMLLSSVILGASSNLFDRFRYGYVVDYFDLYLTIFNIADMVIVGTFFIGFVSLTKK